MINTTGWSVKQWLEHHIRSTPENSLKVLEDLLCSQQVAPKDPAWISLISIDNLHHQWNILQSKSHKEQLPLYGVPVAVKDNIDYKGLPTTAACPSFSYEPSNDAYVVELLRDAGAIILGKTNMDQFATGLVGTRSPYGKTPCVFSDKHVSGGSSAGSASVVARGIVPISLGTDTAGSGRVPAALNNIIGLKPTKGVFSCRGVVPACKSLDCVSIFSLYLADAETAFNIMCQSDGENDEYSREFPRNPLSQYPEDLIVGIPKEISWFGDTENSEIYTTCLESLERSGATIKPIDFSPLLELANCLYEGPWVVERYCAIKEFLATDPPVETLDSTVMDIIKGAKVFDAPDVFEYEYKRQGILQKVKRMAADFDVLCVPSCPLNPTIDDVMKEPFSVNSKQGTWTNFVNLADLAALAIPGGFRSDGLSNGITLIGQKFTDYALMNLAKRFFSVKFPNNTRTSGVLFNKSITLEDEINGPPLDSSSGVCLAVVGAHLRGLPLHWQLEKCNATYISSPLSSAKYRLYALPKTGPILKPGLRRVTDGTGHKIELELYTIPYERFGEFISMVPQPLGIGSVELESGEWVKSFICEEFGYKEKGTIDITEFGGFRSYVDHLHVLEHQRKKPFETVLVANRGEIAVRIIKTLKKMNIKAVAVFSDLDKYSPHVEDADLSVHLNGRTAAETYLDIDKIIKAAKSTNAEAIIPGYGFLSENAEFSDRCVSEGIVFVGPSGDAIRKLGLKHSARKIAKEAGVPLVPGSNLIANAQQAKEAAKELGYPVMVKSTAGGGGIGLQKVDSEDEIENVFKTVQHQGKCYFGDSGVFLERFVSNARHVEVQIMGDGYGKAIAIGERDCSLQRRNQKIIEETPAPNLPNTTRCKMRKAAESLGSLLKYKCAGTVEFIYDQQRDEFYFLEVNARLQVEHPITEMVTGLDLVEWMLRIAGNDSPDFESVKIQISGVSIEARLYAENPVKDFRPSPGQLTSVSFPDWTRVDSWVRKGTNVSAEYDPTLAKIIVHGNDRNDAIRKLNQALNETSVYGCMTNVDYLRSIASSDIFKEARMTTKVLDSYNYEPRAFEVLSPGSYTTVQDYPGRTGLWRIGVPPSGPMDSYSFRLANRIVGNNVKAPGIEITLTGPKLLFHTECVISITGGQVPCSLNNDLVDQYKPITTKKGDILTIGKLSNGSRAYLSIRGGIDIPEYLGSRSTFAMGALGGHNGRPLKTGDVLFLDQPELSTSTLPAPDSKPQAAPQNLIPIIPKSREWKIAVICGPHCSTDLFNEDYIERFFKDTWKVHYNSNRFGVRLIGPKPIWARKDGGEAGLHPSNAHDYVYSLGAINFTGDEPVIITCDGPSLGGFVCHAVVVEAELWKVGQLLPGDKIQFCPISFKVARQLKESQDHLIKTFTADAPLLLTDSLILPKYENPILSVLTKGNDMSPKVTYRQAGDRYILVEYGELELDLNVCYRIRRLIEEVNKHKTSGIVEMSQGVRSVLIEFDGYKISQKALLKCLLSYEAEIQFSKNWSVPSRIFKLPMAFEDSKTLNCVTRYQETIRSDAPWLPNNVDFIADVNDVSRNNVKSMLYSARFMVLGLGDVFLGSPCAVPLDPRHRYLGTKYNPSRTYTARGVVGIGGMYMCIYNAEGSPGGYQLVGRTIPTWDKLIIGDHMLEHPWLLSPFDQVEFYPVTEEELEVIVEDNDNGKFKIEIEESVFDHKNYISWVNENIDSITAFQCSQGGEKADEFARLIQVANAESKNIKEQKSDTVEEYPTDAELIYSEYTGRFWKPLVSVGHTVKEGQGVAIIEAMKTEMVVSATKSGTVYKILYQNGDMVEAGDLIAVIT